VPLFQERSIGDDLTLGRRPRTQPATQGPIREVLVRFGLGDNLDHPLNADLAFKCMPGEHEGNTRVRREFLSLAAIVVREEREPAIIERFEKHEPRGRKPIRCGCRQHECVRFMNARSDRLSEPSVKERERIVPRVLLGKPVGGVFLPHVCQRWSAHFFSN